MYLPDYTHRNTTAAKQLNSGCNYFSASCDSFNSILRQRISKLPQRLRFSGIYQPISEIPVLTIEAQLRLQLAFYYEVAYDDMWRAVMSISIVKQRSCL